MLAVAALLALLAASTTATAAPKPIKGKLTKRGYTVIALDETGEAQTTEAKPKFKLRPPSKRVSLHLQAKNGTYAGPVVVGSKAKGRGTGRKQRLELRKKKGKKLAIVGVKAGANLGKVKVNKRRGYAKAKPKKKKQLDKKRTAKAKKGVPIGAGSFGLVRSKVKSKSPPGDMDADGVSDPLDIDTNGNRVIDRYEGTDQAGAASSGGGDPTATASAQQTISAVVLAVNPDGSVLTQTCNSDIQVTTAWPSGSPTPVVGSVYEAVADVTPQQITVLSVSGPIPGGCPPPIPSVSPGLMLTLKDTVNANAAGLTVSDVDQTLAERGTLYIQGGRGPGFTVELDCGGSADPNNPDGLSYCKPGGTGRAASALDAFGSPPRSWPLAFPACCDSDGDGFGDLGPLVQGQQDVGAFLSPGATTDQIGTGDILNWQITQGGAEREFPRALSDVVATVPALVSYHDGAGDSATVSYPLQPPYVGSGTGLFGESPGSEGFPVAPCPAGAPAPCVAGDVVLTLEFWRPQREAIPGEQGQWTDIGGLVYSPGFSAEKSIAGSNISKPNCKPSQLSTTDPHLTQAPSNFAYSDGYGFRDSADDQPADPANKLSFSVNVSKCLGTSWGPGEGVNMWLVGGVSQGSSGAVGTNSTTQVLRFTRK